MARTKSFDKDEILMRALDLFWTNGYHATSIQNLVDHLGINRASIYDTWGDKHGLYLESLKAYRRQTSNSFIEKLRSNKSSKEIIRDFLTDIVEDSVSDKMNKGCFLSNSATELANSDQEIYQLFTDSSNTMKAVLAELILDGQNQNEISKRFDNRSLAAYLHTIASGLRVVSKGEKSKEELVSIISIALSSID